MSCCVVLCCIMLCYVVILYYIILHYYYYITMHGPMNVKIVHVHKNHAIKENRGRGSTASSPSEIPFVNIDRLRVRVGLAAKRNCSSIDW